MSRLILQGAVALILVLTPIRSTALNFLEIWLTKEADGSGGFTYGVELEGLGKTGATTCKIATASGSSACVPISGEFLPEQDFFDTRMFSTFGQLLSEIQTNWTITWDEGLSTETIATVDFLTEQGDITENSWLSVFPNITNPIDGSMNVSPATSIDWDYGGVDVSTVDPNGVLLLLRRGQAEQHLFDLEDCQITTGVCDSVTPTSALAGGDWKATVVNGVNIRNVPDGISSTGDAWILSNSSWLFLASTDRSSFGVLPEPSTAFLLASGLGVLAVRRRGRLIH